MELSVAERILLLSILPPAEGNALFLRAVRRLRKSLSFTQQEIADWKITGTADGTFNWDNTAAKSVDLDLTGTGGEYITICLKRIDAAGSLNEALLPIYDHFFPEGTP